MPILSKKELVRPFIEDDVSQVADLYWKAFYRRRGSSPAPLRSYFGELFFHNPWYDDSLPSLVYENHQGRIVGFLGVLPRRMLVQGRPIQVAFGSNFMVDPEGRSTMAALQLLRTFFSGKQDLSMGDSANGSTYRIWNGLGGETAQLYSVKWSRPLRPCVYGLYATGILKPGTLMSPLRFALKPICHTIDALMARMPAGPFRLSSPALSEEELDASTLLSLVSELSARYSVRPEYSHASLEWLFRFIHQAKAFRELRKVALRDEQQRVAGSYMYYIKKDGLGEVVQLGARYGATGKVLDHLFCDAWKRGAMALHGRLDFRIAEELSQRFCFFWRLGDWVLVYSRNCELRQRIRAGDAFLSRLDGEWCMAWRGE